MKIETYMQKYGLSYKQVYDRIKKGELPAVKTGKEWNITLDIEPTLPEKPRANLKDALTAMQIKKIQQQLEDGKEAIRNDYKHELIQEILEATKAIRDCIAGMNLNAEQVTELRACVEKFITRND